MFSRKYILLVPIILAFKLIDGQRRIFEGDDLRYDLHKYLVHLELNENKAQHTCSGSIINANWIITAGHCVNPQDLVYVNVTQGIEKNVIAIVDKDDAHRHPEFYLENFRRDVGLLHVRQDIEFNDNIQPIELVTDEPANGEIGIIAGYGNNECEVSPPREAPVVIRRCPYNDTIILCSYNFSGGRADHGDSGGPLVSNWRLAGIITGGFPNETLLSTKKICATSYANIAENMLWINSIMNGKL